MKTKTLRKTLVIIVAGALNIYNVQSQTALNGSAAASNSCGTPAGTPPLSVASRYA